VHIPVALHPKHFGDPSFNIDNGSAFMNGLKKALLQLANVQLPVTRSGKLADTSKAVDAAYLRLGKYIYLGQHGTGIHAKIQRDPANPSHIRSLDLEFTDKSDIDGRPRAQSEWVVRHVVLATLDSGGNYVPRDKNIVYREIVRALAAAGVPVRVAKEGLLSDYSAAYIKQLVDADVLQSNLLDDRVKSVYATFKPLAASFLPAGTVAPVMAPDVVGEIIVERRGERIFAPAGEETKPPGATTRDKGADTATEKIRKEKKIQEELRCRNL
jgi:hypothetical protein